jgi:tRNA1Val (adenine37-N6)-methyltransferase
MARSLIVLVNPLIRRGKSRCDGSDGSLFAGRVVCRQPRHGYRFSIDSVLLAHFSPLHAGDSVLDLGCGCGIVGLILLFRHPGMIHKMVGLEIQPELAELAKENVLLNGFEHTFRILVGDLRCIGEHVHAESFSKVFCNPPFYRPGTGRKNIGKQSLIARHQVCSSTKQIMIAASFAVKNKGSVILVYPAGQLGEIFDAMTAVKLQPKRLQIVYNYPGQQTKAKLVLVEAIKNGGVGITILPPFYVYREKNGPYSDEMQEFYKSQRES